MPEGECARGRVGILCRKIVSHEASVILNTQYSKQLLDMPKTGTYDQKLRKTIYSRKRAIDNLGIGFNGKGL